MHFQVQMQDNDTNNIFVDKETTNKVNVTFLAVINKKIRCARCIYNVNYIKIGMVMHFQIKMLQKFRKYIFREKKTTKKVLLKFLDVKRFTER